MTKRRNPKVQCCTATVIAKLRVQFDFCCRKTDKRNAPREAVLSRLEDRTTYVYVGGHDVESPDVSNESSRGKRQPRWLGALTIWESGDK